MTPRLHIEELVRLETCFARLCLRLRRTKSGRKGGPERCKVPIVWRSGVLWPGSAKPLSVGSIPTRASNDLGVTFVLPLVHRDPSGLPLPAEPPDKSHFTLGIFRRCIAAAYRSITCSCCG
jgi:hypothetical protein